MSEKLIELELRIGVLERHQKKLDAIINKYFEEATTRLDNIATILDDMEKRITDE